VSSCDHYHCLFIVFLLLLVVFVFHEAADSDIYTILVVGSVICV